MPDPTHHGVDMFELEHPDKQLELEALEEPGADFGSELPDEVSEAEEDIEPHA